MYVQVMEHGSSPEPSKEETSRLLHNEEWSILMEEQLLPNMEVYNRSCMVAIIWRFIAGGLFGSIQSSVHIVGV